MDSDWPLHTFRLGLTFRPLQTFQTYQPNLLRKKKQIPSRSVAELSLSPEFHSVVIDNKLPRVLKAPPKFIRY